MPEARETSGNHVCSRPGRTWFPGSPAQHRHLAPLEILCGPGAGGPLSSDVCSGSFYWAPWSRTVVSPLLGAAHIDRLSLALGLQVKGEGRCPGAGGWHCWAPAGRGGHLVSLSLDKVKGKRSK